MWELLCYISGKGLRSMTKTTEKLILRVAYSQGKEM